MNRFKNLLEKEKWSNFSLGFYKLIAVYELDKKKSILETLKDNVDWYSVKEACNMFETTMEQAKSGFETKTLRAKTGYRFITGMGYPSPVENGMLLHHIYGIPYIHGESVKGLVRHVFCEKIAYKEEENYDEFLKALKNLIQKLEEETYEDEKVLKEYTLLFGTKKREGAIVFFDAYPQEIRKDNFVIDIMNPHYVKYYAEKGKEPPADWYNPTPIFFLALEDIEFVFTIGYDPLRLGKEEGDKLIEKAVSYLRKGLEMYGMGAKKRKGYGWFNVSER